MKQVLLILLLALFTHGVSAQNERTIDSLKAIVDSDAHDTVRIQALGQ